jgi:hypothetical protein
MEQLLETAEMGGIEMEIEEMEEAAPRGLHRVAV